MSLSGLLQVSRSALSSYQMAIDVTGGNIANVSTPGYSRQRAVLSTTGGVQSGATSSQMCVEVTKVERIFDNYLETQIVGQQQKAGYSETESSFLGRIEGVFNDLNNTGLNDVMGRFWGSWDDLAANPGGQVERVALLSASEELVSRFNTMATDLADIKQDAKLSIKDTIQEINKLTSRIADLNKSIFERGNMSGESNRLLDDRSVSLNSLSELIDLNYVVDDNGSLSVFLPSGKKIIGDALALELDYKSDNVVFKDASSEILDDVLSRGENGKLAALLNVRDDYIPGYQSSLDDLAKEIITQVNKSHREGYDAYQNTGNDFFVPAGVDNIAQHMAVKDAIIDDVNRIAASAVVSSGNGEIALNISNLKNGSMLEGTLLGSKANLSGAVAITAATVWNKIDGAKVANGTKFTITGKANDGTAVTKPDFYTINNITTGTVQDLLTAIETAYDGNVTASVDKYGKIRVTDDKAGDSQLEVTLTVTNVGSGKLDFGKIAKGDVMTFGSYYGSLVGQVGRDVADANSNAEQQDTILTQLISHRDAVSGVSVDEEMMNIIKYQMGYNAAGRLFQTVNELFDTLMSLGR